MCLKPFSLILASVGWERYKAVKRGEGFKGEEK
jgi:hypothetical protein